LYRDAEVLVLPPVFLPQDSVFVGRRLRRHPTGSSLAYRTVRWRKLKPADHELSLAAPCGLFCMLLLMTVMTPSMSSYISVAQQRDLKKKKKKKLRSNGTRTAAYARTQQRDATR